MSWDADVRTFANGTSPTKWRIVLDFSALYDRDGVLVPTDKIRKLRWTYAADLQSGAYRPPYAYVLALRPMSWGLWADWAELRGCSRAAHYLVTVSELLRTAGAA